MIKTLSSLKYVTVSQHFEWLKHNRHLSQIYYRYMQALFHHFHTLDDVRTISHCLKLAFVTYCKP